MGLSGDEIILIKADANDLPFAHEFFNAIICADSYNYFGRDDSFLDEKIIPFIKPGGYVYIAVPGMKKDCHDDLPDELMEGHRNGTFECCDGARACPPGQGAAVRGRHLPARLCGLHD